VRFQTIAPASAANTIIRPLAVLVTDGSTIPFAIVDATLIEMNAPRKFRHPDMITATIGFSAPVAIDVATAFAVS
jgi:stringent starvation protein B